MAARFVLLLTLGLSGIFFLFPDRADAQTSTIGFAKGGKTAVNTAVVRSVEDQGLKGVRVTYAIPGGRMTEKQYAGKGWKRLSLENFGYLMTAGRPALPVRYDFIVIPENSNLRLKTRTIRSATIQDVLALPALKPATDRKGDPEPAFEMDTAYYRSHVKYPDTPVKIERILHIAGYDVAMIRVCPAQYLPGSKKLRIFTELTYDLNINGGQETGRTISPGTAMSAVLSNLVLNPAALHTASSASTAFKAVEGIPVNYVILTHSDYLAAADSLAAWKSQLGYSCEVISAQSWTSPQVKTAIQQRYQSWNPRPEYFVILGDHDRVPGEIHQDPTYGDSFATDLYYVCMDGPGDNIPDMAYGRISVSSAAEALSVVQKIIRYEKNPPAQPAFYHSGVNCANFQDDDTNSYEDRRFALTEEELRDYMVNQQGFSITRVYQADNNVTPLYWNNDYYAAGEPLPSYLLKPGFAWDGDKYDIRDELNSSSGRLFITHRDHGYVGGSGWANPQFTTTDINMLSNGDRTPVVFSINCHTGEYQLPVCFAEKFLRVPNGGAVGVFGAAYYSYSGYNDGLILGMFDAIWPNPGILPNFTGYADDPVGSPLPHSAMYCMGDVLNQGILRMMQTWGDDAYTHELFHYFGDPSMKIWTGEPAPVTAVHQDSLFCGDTIFRIDSCSYLTGLATLVADGQLIAKTFLSNGSGILHFAPLAGNRVLLTISGHNYRPYVAGIPVDSNCIRAGFQISDSGMCIHRNFIFTDQSSGNILAYAWDFGEGAVPATASTNGPHAVYYTTPGAKTIRLTVTGSSGNHTTVTNLEVDQVCTYSMVQNDYSAIDACEGILTDNGGYTNYRSGADDTTTITASGAASLQLLFRDFDVETGSNNNCDYDWLSLYDGPTVGSPLLGTYCNAAGMNPPAVLQTTSNSVTVVFHSDAYTEMRGYEMEWSCTSPGTAPNATFLSDRQWSCDGLIQFTDHSTNTPTSWHWDFGDGDSSGLANPLHQYTANGVYTVTLTTENAFGTDTYVLNNYITVSLPEAPAAQGDILCLGDTATLAATGNGTIYWFDAPNGGSLLDTGNFLTVPALSSTTSFYAEDHPIALFHTAPMDSAIGDGLYYTGTSNHYIRFDAINDLKLKSVLVYAQTNAVRKISLRNSSGSVLCDTAILINSGKQRIQLNFPVPAGNGYRLQCDSVNRLYRNSAGATFPYLVPELIRLTGNSYTNQNYYYFFYDWEVERSTCVSPRSEAIAWVHASDPVAAFTFSQNVSTFAFTDQSQDAGGWSWDFGDGTQSSQQNPEHEYGAFGTYVVRLIVTNGCGSDTLTDTIDYYTVGLNDSGSRPTLRLWPNPAGDQIVMSADHLDHGTVMIRIIDMTGRIIRNNLYHHQPGRTCTMSLEGLTPGVYILSVSAGEWSDRIRFIKF